MYFQLPEICSIAMSDLATAGAIRIARASLPEAAVNVRERKATKHLEVLS